LLEQRYRTVSKTVKGYEPIISDKSYWRAIITIYRKRSAFDITVSP
jgi:hypothetical protein